MHPRASQRRTPFAPARCPDEQLALLSAFRELQEPLMENASRTAGWGWVLLRAALGSDRSDKGELNRPGSASESRPKTTRQHSTRLTV